MDRDELSGITREMDLALSQAAAAGRVKKETTEASSVSGERMKAWKQPEIETEELLLDEEPTGDPLPMEESEEPEGPGEREKAGRSLFRPSDGLLAAFFIPVIVMVVIFAQRGIFPFGQESFLRTDMYHQYAPFFSEFQYKLREGGSLLYSWDIGMGVNFAALYAYYLASPLNWLLILCPKGLIIEFMTYLIVVKMGLSGLSFAWYLKKHNRTDDFGVGFFGIFYALSGYMAAYSWNIMWLDCILLFPLIVLGLERLVNEKKGMLYCLTLGVSILSNYYISIMICLFLVIYFVCLEILKGRQRMKDYAVNALQFGGYSLLAGGLAAFVLLPEIAALQSTASGSVTFPKTFELYFSIIDMLARHIGNVQTEVGLNHWPNLYCGVAVYLFFLLYLACGRISLKEKAVYCGLLLLFFASFSINVLNFIWHGFHYPNSLPCRQSFIYIFLILSVCYRSYQYLKETSRKRIAIAFWGAICFVLLAQKLVTEEAFHFVVFYVAILFLALYAGLIYFYQNPKRSKTVAAFLTLGVVAVETAVNMAVTSVTITSRTAYTEDNRAVAALKNSMKSDSGFYRVDKNKARTKNDGAWMNFPSASLFSSLASADMTEFFKKVGLEGSTNAYSIVGSTPLIDSLLSLRFALYEGEQANPRLALSSFSGDTYLYENPYTLPLGFMMPDIMETGWQLELPNPIDVQNDLSEILEVPPSFSEAYGDNNGVSFSFTAQEDGEYYICVMNQRVKSVKLTIGERTDTIENLNRGFLIETGYLTAGETVSLNNKEGSDELNARAYRFQEAGLKGVYERLSAKAFTVTEWEDSRLFGQVEAGEGGTLFLSIPYDEGWRALVDGQPMTMRKVLGAFSGVELSKGTHQLELIYRPRGLREGLTVTAVSAGLLLLLAVTGVLRNKRRQKTPYDKLDEPWKHEKEREDNQ